MQTKLTLAAPTPPPPSFEIRPHPLGGYTLARSLGGSALEYLGRSKTKRKLQAFLDRLNPGPQARLRILTDCAPLMGTFRPVADFPA